MGTISLRVLLKVLIFTYFAFSSSYCRSFINHYPRMQAYRDDGDTGEPLFLTPLIAKNVREARSMAKVIGSQFLSVESYSGYLTVDKELNSNMFFWFFPAEETPETAPVVLWLQGGPGVSSLFGLFNENGPFEFDKDKLKKREYRWNKNINLIYIDNPVGTGFSFTERDEGYSRNETQVAHNLYEAVRQLFTLFEFKNTKGFWITGESYAGKYVPALAYYTHYAQLKDDIKIPLKGMAIGNGLSDPQNQLNYADYLYQLGLIDFRGRELFHETQQQVIDCIRHHDMKCAFDVFDRLIDMGESPYDSLFHNLTGYETYSNYLQPKAIDIDKTMEIFLQSPDTRRAIHVGNKTFHGLDSENKVEEHLKLDVMDSVAPWVADILNNNYSTYIYNGQLDIIVAYPLTVNYLQNLKFKAAGAYKNATRQVWWVDGEIAGYKKTAGSLTEILVRNAGHMVLIDQPKWMFDLISTITETKLKETI